MTTQAKQTPISYAEAEWMTDGEQVYTATETICTLTGENSEANARLIALAPEMADALEYIGQMLDAFKPDALKSLGLDVAAEQVRALLAKLNGAK